MRQIIYGLLIIFLSSRLAFAEDVSFTAEVNSQTVDMQSAIQLTLTINGVQNVDPITLPVMDGFDAQYQGPARRVSIVNGQYSSSIAFNYVLYPKKIGVFEIPAFSLTLDGKSYTSQPIRVEVVQSSPQAAPASPAVAGAPNDQALDLKDRLFLQFKIPQEEAFINQKIPVKIFLFVSNLPLRDIQPPQIEQTGIKLAEIPRPQQYQQVINGVRYDIVEFNTYFYPTRAGELELGPVTMDANLLYRNSNPGSQSAFGSLFDDEFFGEFFNRYDKRPVRLTSPQQKLVVRDLPEEGKPADFSGAVGQFEFEAQASPAKVQAGDPLTLRMSVKGEGNLASIQFPHLPESNQLKVYEPTIKEENGVKIFEQVVIPLSPEVKEIPALNFSYFDPNLKSYRTITKGPFPIDVTPSATGEGVPMVSLPSGVTTAPAAAEPLGSDIIYLKSDFGKLRKRGQDVNPLWLVLMGLFFIGWILFHVFFDRWQKMHSDQSYARQLLAPKKAKENLRQLERLINNANDKEFYSLAFKTIQEYFSDKLGIPAGNVHHDTVIEHPKMQKFDEGHRRELQAVFAECEAASFASLSMGEEKRRATFNQLRKLIDYGQRVIR